MTPKNTPASDEAKATKKDIDRAIQYVNNMDLIFDENRRIAGQSFVDGLREARTESLAEIAKLRTELNKARCGCSSCVAHDEVLNAED